jgi:flavin reductase (DIM6/NTAB) family NADH-FMN oxidoreductase RutF
MSAKVLLQPDALLFPVPVVLLSCAGAAGPPGLIAISWVSVVCATPPMVGVAMRAERYSYGLVRESGEFVLNIPTAALLRAVDFCGTVSGHTVDKFRETGLTPVPGVKVHPPLVQECPVNLECVVRETRPLGSHTLFLAEVVAVHADDAVVEEGQVVAGRLAPLAFDPFGGNYWSLRDAVAHHGFSDGRMRDRRDPEAPATPRHT